MRADNRLDVYYEDRLVGTLAMTADKQAAFAYDGSWLAEGFSISPFSLPLKQEVFVPTKHYFHGLFGVFADSLPDAWGNILLNNVLKKNGIQPQDLNILDRLAIVGQSGMGALTYRPAFQIAQKEAAFDLDRLAEESRLMLEKETVQDLDLLYQMGGTSGGVLDH